MNNLKQFEDMTIKELIKLTEDYKKLLKENKILKTKYPNKLPMNKIKPETAEQIIGDLK